jgi:hypothetical protein
MRRRAVGQNPEPYTLDKSRFSKVKLQAKQVVRGPLASRWLQLGQIC